LKDSPINKNEGTEFLDSLAPLRKKLKMSNDLEEKKEKINPGWPLTIKVDLIEAIGLTNSTIGFQEMSCPYIVLSIGEQKQTSKIVKNNLDPKFNETFSLIFFPNVDKLLKIEVYDYDLLVIFI
jgi:Ca2+-dependent lipid-binding protein